MRKYTAEFIGTALLVFFGCGTTVAAAALLGAMGMLAAAFCTLTVAAAFGLAVTVLTLAFGRISGGHLNPAVSVALCVSGGMSVRDCICYVIAQFLGSIGGAALLMAVVGGRTSLAANGYDSLSTFGCEMWVVALIEVLITFTLIWTVLTVREKKDFRPSQAVYTGLAVTMVYLFAYPFTGASANPARSLGPAVFQEGDALSQVWLFIAAPLAGALIAAVLHKLLTGRLPSQTQYQGPLSDIIEKCTAIDPRDRFQSCTDLFLALDNSQKEQEKKQVPDNETFRQTRQKENAGRQSGQPKSANHPSQKLRPPLPPAKKKKLRQHVAAGILAAFCIYVSFTSDFTDDQNRLLTGYPMLMNRIGSSVGLILLILYFFNYFRLRDRFPCRHRQNAFSEILRLAAGGFLCLLIPAGFVVLLGG